VRQICLAGLLALAAGCSSSEVVVVYSPHGSEMLGDYEALFEAAHPGVDLQWLDMGAQEVYSRIRAEQGRPACDVWWGAPSTLFERAAAEGLLAPYRPSWADTVAAEHRDPQDRWYATFLSPLAIVFNDRGLEAADAPQTWEALLEPAWHGRISLRKPLASGTMRTFIAAMIARAPDEDAGLDWLRRLHAATGDYPESPNLLYDHLKKNPDKVSVWLMPDVILQRERNGYPFGFVVPPDTPVLTDGIALVQGAPHAEWGRKFYEFVTTREALLQQAAAYAKLPARTDIPASALPEALAAQPIQPMKLDWARISAHESAWCARWEKEVYAVPGAGG
jgi:iron(III) transport system substrate-binding protein